MKTNLLAMAGGRLRLEIASADRRKVADRIYRLFGMPEIATLTPSSSRFRFAGEEFMFRDESDQPRLVSSSQCGDAVLTQLLGALEPVAGRGTGRPRHTEGTAISVGVPDSSQS